MIKISIPSSKSIYQRLLILSSLAQTPSTINNPSRAGDCKFLENSMKLCGIKIIHTGNSILIKPAPVLFPDVPINCGDGGTTVRFMSSLSLLSDKPLHLDVEGSMKKRPVSGLLESLEKLGVKHNGKFPLTLERQSCRSEAFVDTSLTSQFLSSLILVCPSRKIDTKITYKSNPVSSTYISMTERCLNYYNIGFSHNADSYSFSPVIYDGIETTVEPDASAAALFEAFRPHFKKEFQLTSGTDEFDFSKSIQGDSIFYSFQKQINEQVNFEFDISSTPDLIVPLTLTGILGSDPINIRGITHTYHKESRRPEILKNELAKVGCKIDISQNEMTVYPGINKNSATLDPHADHRLAMAFGFLSIVSKGISVKNKDCTVKSFPDFFSELEKLR
ncbi:hypothetical protein KKF34_07585 [Myxococcota bacterium]|nr:hypothetical protein [Myxococcota bacterium]MBU1381149.1 hypothetical protein [Myxococcota bacterium]MBU1496721.1 hypothetical protein [Myxococcota bacterium]